MATKKKKKISVRLPNKLGKMLTKALDDLEWVEKNPKYKVNMMEFARKRAHSGVCEVCLGGSQLIGNLPKGEFVIRPAEHLSPSTARKLFALDALRKGFVGNAIAEIQSSDPSMPVAADDHVLDMEDVASYHDNPELWKAQMRLLAVKLEQANI